MSDTGKVAAFWLILTYLLHTCGELSLSPVGLSAVTKLSPVKIVPLEFNVELLKPKNNCPKHKIGLHIDKDKIIKIRTLYYLN